MFIRDFIKLFSEKMIKVFKFFPVCHQVVDTNLPRNANKHFYQNLFRLIFQFCDGHVRNILMDKKHNTITIMVSILSVYTVWKGFWDQF